ncbi:MAG: pilus assembly FimT family protein [Candidatus Hydrogenedentales bacterium]|jgi:prepilin-type N-terminal cleavage/methylation domain-containing protein
MKTLGTRMRGFTLIELLVVIAIITILAGVTIPTLIKSGAFQKEHIEESGRTLYNMLRAAEFYAATYNVEACLAYAAKELPDSRDPSTFVVVARSVGVFRRATDEELEAWQSYYASTPDAVLLEEYGGLPVYTPVFMPVAGNELTALGEGACVLGDWDTSVDPPVHADFWEDVLGYPVKGLRPVRIRNEDGELVRLSPPHHVPYLYEFEPYPGDFHSVDDCWMAHVFSPAGYVDAPVAQERLMVTVGPTPDSGIDDRFIDLTETPLDASQLPPGYTWDIFPVAPVKVQISKSSARVKMVE